MTIAIWIPSSSGHRLNYVRELIRQNRTTGNSLVLVGTPQTRATPEWKLRESELKNIEFFEIRSLIEVSELMNKVAISKIVIPDGDLALFDLARLHLKLRKLNSSVLLMRAQPQDGFGSTIRFVTKYILAHLLNLSSRVQMFELGSAKGKIARKFSFAQMQDPPNIFELSQDYKPDFSSQIDSEFIFCLLGVIDERKNPIPITDAFLRSEIPDSQLVIAGQISVAIDMSLKALVKNSKKVVVVDRILSDSEFEWLMQRSDVFLCVYQNVGSSGIAINAERNRKIVVGGGNKRAVAELEKLSSRFIPVFDSDPTSIGLAMELAKEGKAVSTYAHNSNFVHLKSLL
jgi:hypothetical protein